MCTKALRTEWGAGASGWRRGLRPSPSTESRDPAELASLMPSCEGRALCCPQHTANGAPQACTCPGAGETQAYTPLLP